jgi:hypothetical protein
MNIQNTATKKSPLDLRDYAAVIGIDSQTLRGSRARK